MVEWFSGIFQGFQKDTFCGKILSYCSKNPNILMSFCKNNVGILRDLLKCLYDHQKSCKFRKS